MGAGLGGDEISLRIEDLGKSKFLRFAEKVYEFTKQTVPAYSSKYSKKTFTQHQLIAIICFGGRENKTYEGIIGHLIEEPRIRKALDLDEVLSFDNLQSFREAGVSSLGVTHLQTSGFFD